MKRQIVISAWAVSLSTLMIGLAAHAASIRVSAQPQQSVAKRGDEIVVPVIVDISRLPEKLGSFTAELSWDPAVLKFTAYEAGASEAFRSPVVNTGKTGEGRLIFAAANPRGATGVVEILRVKFRVTGEQGTSTRLRLRFTAMAAAYTFTNLLPYLQQTVTGVESELRIGDVPRKYALLQNWPNPFNPSTEIRFELPKTSRVLLVIYNHLGQRVKTLVNETRKAGVHSVEWDGTDESGRTLSGGVYFCRIRAGDFEDIKKMLLVR